MPTEVTAEGGIDPDVAAREQWRHLVFNSTSDVEGCRFISCFHVRLGFRCGGQTRILIEAAVRHAAASGAHRVEAAPTRAIAAAERFVGRTSTVSACGGSAVQERSTNRGPMRRAVASRDQASAPLLKDRHRRPGPAEARPQRNSGMPGMARKPGRARMRRVQARSLG